MAQAMNAYSVTIESDERGFELHIDTDEGVLIFNVHGVAEQLFDEAVKVIGPWLAEGRAARREYDSGIADDPSQQAVLDRIKGVDDPFPQEVLDRIHMEADHADMRRKQEKGE